MGCDTVEYCGSVIGYAIDYDALFKHTVFQAKEEYDYETRDEAFEAINDKWEEYRQQKFPIISKMWPDFLTVCGEFSGEYESIGLEYRLVWGYEMESKKIKLESNEKCDKVLLEFDFPANSKSVLSDFLTTFVTDYEDKSNDQAEVITISINDLSIYGNLSAG
jgi:hypothetical protein